MLTSSIIGTALIFLCLEQTRRRQHLSNVVFRLTLLFSLEYCSRTSGKVRAIIELGAVHILERWPFPWRDYNLSTSHGEDKQLGRAQGNFGGVLSSVMSKGTLCFPLHLLFPPRLCAQPHGSCAGSQLPQGSLTLPWLQRQLHRRGETSPALLSQTPAQMIPGVERRKPSKSFL